MRDYESTFILAPTLDSEGVQGEITAVKDVITGQGGEITAEKEWGRRRLAYPIQDHSEGVYHVLRFTLDGSKLPELDRHFRLNENVLRSLVIQDEGTPLEQIGQSSESEEYGDSRDRRHGPYRSGRPEASPRPAADAPPSKAPEAREAGPAKVGASEEAPAASASESGGEEKT